jgi:hypothetical protein
VILEITRKGVGRDACGRGEEGGQNVKMIESSRVEKKVRTV